MTSAFWFLSDQKELKKYLEFSSCSIYSGENEPQMVSLESRVPLGFLVLLPHRGVRVCVCVCGLSGEALPRRVGASRLMSRAWEEDSASAPVAAQALASRRPGADPTLPPTVCPVT